MNILPYYSFEIKSSLSVEESFAVLNSEVEPNKWFRFSSNHKLFEGTVSREGFKIKRIINYRNSFLPVIYGTFTPGLNGTIVNIKMKMYSGVYVFMCFWFCAVGTGLFAGINQFHSSKVQQPDILIPLGMLLFGIVLVSGGFWFEVKQAIPILNRIFMPDPLR
jgi:hypothetical protein